MKKFVCLVFSSLSLLACAAVMNSCRIRTEAPQRQVTRTTAATVEGGSPSLEPQKVRSVLSWNRPVLGQPISDAERKETTRLYLELLDKTRYYAVLNERIHGWPASDSRYPWWGIWWIGVQIKKTADGIAFLHHKTGSDNAASDTAMMLENTCYAHALWRNKSAASALHKLIRGMEAQSLAMRSKSRSYSATLLARSFYPVSVVSKDDGRSIPLIYDAARPGEDNSAAEYVHIPDNPFWGDIYVKNKRSKDDISHVIRALSQVDASCGESQKLDAAMVGDWSRALSRYQAWAAQVYTDNWRIATLDKSLKLVFPPDTLANFYPIAECNAMFAISMFGRGDGGGKECGSGLGGIVDWVAMFNDQNIGILETFHQAAVIAALKFKRDREAFELMKGLVSRQERHLDAWRKGKMSEHYSVEKLSGFMLRNAAMGVPLLDGEVRWLQKQIKAAHDSYLKPARDHHYDIENAEIADGIYPYNAYGAGLHWRDIGAVVGLCTSPYVNRHTVQIVDCAALGAHQLAVP